MKRKLPKRNINKKVGREEEEIKKKRMGEGRFRQEKERKDEEDEY